MIYYRRSLKNGFQPRTDVGYSGLVDKAVKEDRAKQADSLQFSREMLIDQAKFRASADKRGMGYLMEEEFDLKVLRAKV